MGLHRRVRDGAASGLWEAEEAEDAHRVEDRAVPGAPPDAAGVRLPNKMGQQASRLQGLLKSRSSHHLCCSNTCVDREFKIFQALLQRKL